MAVNSWYGQTDSDVNSTTLVTTGLPWERVPVLSKMTVLTCGKKSGCTQVHICVLHIHVYVYVQVYRYDAVCGRSATSIINPYVHV